MINFYGGPKGENYVVSHTFGNTQELLKDLELGGASPVDLNEIVMISYGLPGSEKYEENMKKDYSSDIIDNFYFTYNPYLEYYPSVEHHFGTNGHSKLYTILDKRYEGSYNGIKNMMHPNIKNCDICEDAENGSVWIKINLTGKVKFNGKFILNDPELQYNLDTTGITWHLASSIEKARNEEYPKDGGKITFKVQTSGGTVNENLSNITNITEVLQSTLFNKGITIENEEDHFKYFVIDNKPEQQLYVILEIHPQTAVDFTDFIIDRSGLQFNSYNFNSCLYQKVLKDTINYDDPFMYITFQGSNFAYKFLNSSIGSSPIINFNQITTDSDVPPSLEKNTELSNSRHQVFDLQLPYPSTIENNQDDKGVYLQLNYKKDDEIQSPKVYMPTLSVSINDNKDGLKFTVTNNDTSQETSIIVVPEFKIETEGVKKGDISWRIKDLDNNTPYISLGNILGPQGDKGDKGDKGDALQVTQQFSVTIDTTFVDEFYYEDECISDGFFEAIKSELIDLAKIEKNEIIIGGINHQIFQGEYNESGEIINPILKDKKSYIAFYTLATDDSKSYFTYQDKKIQFSYIPVSDVGSNIKYISSTENKSLILNTSKDYNLEGKIFGAEGLTAGETNKIGTKVFDIVGYSGIEGGEGHYVLNINDDTVFTELNDCISKAGPKKLRWSIRSQLNYDYAGEILGIEKNEKNEIKLKVNNFFTNEVNIGNNISYSSGKNYGDGARFSYCKPLGYYIDNRVSGDMTYTDATLYICGHPELGTRELYGQSYSFGKDNITQKDLSFQVGANNQGYNKYGITVGQYNISGYGNAIFGRNINAGFAQMNISQGDYNTIGNYAKYDAQFGLNLNSNYDHQYQFGRYNKNKENNIVEVGYGSDDESRKNIFEVDKDGKIYSNEMENMIDQKISIFTDTSNIQITNIEPSWVRYPYPNHQTNQPYNYNGGFGYYMTVSSTCFEKNQRYLVEFCFQLKVTKSGTLDFRELITGTGTKTEVFRKQYQTLNLEVSDSLQTCIISCFINPDTKDEDITNIESYGIGIHESSTAKAIFYHTNTKIRQIYFIDNLFNNYTKNLFIKLKDINIIETGKQDIFSFENNKEYISYNDILYLIPNKAVKNYEIINTYIPSEFTQYNSQKWLRFLKLNETNNNITISCPGLSGEQDVMISFNPEEGISLQDYQKQKEVYESIISNSYAKTIDGAVKIYILDSKIIDASNTTECPILIKVV